MPRRESGILNVSLYARTVKSILQPLRAKWKLRSYSLVIEKLTMDYMRYRELYGDLPKIPVNDIHAKMTSAMVKAKADELRNK